MLIKEYLNIVKDVWIKVKDPCKFELLFIKTSMKKYINEFNLKKYLKEIIFQENPYLNIFLLLFILKIIYDFFMFIFYTLDLYITFFLKWFFFIVYISLDKWEGYLFKKIHEVRKDPVKSKIYKREKAILAKNRAKFFKPFAIDFEKEYIICLKFDKRDYSIIYKYYKYFSILIPAFLKWINYSIQTNIPYIWRQINIWIYSVLIQIYWRKFLLRFKLIFFKFFLNLLKSFIISYYFIKDILIKIYFFFKKNLKMYLIAYNIRKQYRLKFYRFLYINYFFFYKKRSFIENKFSTLNEKELIKYTNYAVSLTFNFYSFNFKFIYFWHCYIKNIPYINYLEYLLNSKYYNYNFENDFKNCSIFIPFNIIRLLNWLSRYLIFIIPYFNKYYIKYMAIIKNYFFKYFFKLVSFFTYIFLPFVFIFCLYKNIKEFYKFFNLFIKILLKNFK